MNEEILREVRKEVRKELNKAKKVYVETCRDGVVLPKYQHEGDAGMDLRSAIDIDIKPGESKIVPTGLKVIIPKGYELHIRARSGISLRTPLRLANSIGTIDSGFRDEIGVIINNISVSDSNDVYDINEKNNRSGVYSIKKGDRIAQMVLCKHEVIEFVSDKESVDELVDDRNGGFGHSGVR